MSQFRATRMMPRSTCGRWRTTSANRSKSGERSSGTRRRSRARWSRACWAASGLAGRPTARTDAIRSAENRVGRPREWRSKRYARWYVPTASQLEPDRSMAPPNRWASPSSVNHVPRADEDYSNSLISEPFGFRQSVNGPLYPNSFRKILSKKLTRKKNSAVASASGANFSRSAIVAASL